MCNCTYHMEQAGGWGLGGVVILLKMNDLAVYGAILQPAACLIARIISLSLSSLLSLLDVGAGGGVNQTSNRNGGWRIVKDWHNG